MTSIRRLLYKFSMAEKLKLSTLVTCPKCGGKGKLWTVNGAFLRQHREHQEVGLREMARKLKLSAAYLSDVELGRRPATSKIVEGYGL